MESKINRKAVELVSMFDQQIAELNKKRECAVAMIMKDIDISVGDVIEITGYSYRGKMGRITSIWPKIKQLKTWSKEEEKSVYSGEYEVLIKTFVQVLKADGTGSAHTANMEKILGKFQAVFPKS